MIYVNQQRQGPVNLSLFAAAQANLLSLSIAAAATDGIRYPLKKTSCPHASCCIQSLKPCTGGRRSPQTGRTRLAIQWIHDKLPAAKGKHRDAGSRPYAGPRRRMSNAYL
jgi:hypothetical protein